jgi:cell division protein ZapA (FtsZ GTPase activity inhibitor)
MKSALLFITRESMAGIMNMEGRINLYKDKFGLRSDKKLFDDDLKDLFQRAVELIDDDELFFMDTVKVIKEYNTLNFFK